MTAQDPELEPLTGELPEPAPKPGRIIATFNGRIVLRDPNAGDVSRAGRPLEPTPPTVAATEDAIVAALTELGYAVTVDLMRTDQ